MSEEESFLSPDSHEFEGLVDPEKLQAYLENTTFEDEVAVVDFLEGRYKMRRLDDGDEIGARQTKEINIKDLSSRALSGEEPWLVFEMNIRTLDEKNLELSIYRVTSSSHSVYEFTLLPLG